MKDPRETISEFCDNLKQKMLDKYELGAIEHQGHWSEVDIAKELAMEVMDVLCYHSMALTKEFNKKC